MLTGESVLPKQQGADGIAPIHRVEQVAHARPIPYERALDIGEAEFADGDVFQQLAYRVINLAEQEVTHVPAPKFI